MSEQQRPIHYGLTEKAMRFWSRVWDGRVRLTGAEDALVWRLREYGYSWNVIAAKIIAERRRDGREQLRRWRVSRQRKEPLDTETPSRASSAAEPEISNARRFAPIRRFHAPSLRGARDMSEGAGSPEA